MNTCELNSGSGSAYHSPKQSISTTSEDEKKIGLDSKPQMEKSITPKSVRFESKEQEEDDFSWTDYTVDTKAEEERYSRMSAKEFYYDVFCNTFTEKQRAKFTKNQTLLALQDISKYLSHTKPCEMALDYVKFWPTTKLAKLQCDYCHHIGHKMDRCKIKPVMEESNEVDDLDDTPDSTGRSKRVMTRRNKAADLAKSFKHIVGNSGAHYPESTDPADAKQNEVGSDSGSQSSDDDDDKPPKIDLGPDMLVSPGNIIVNPTSQKPIIEKIRLLNGIPSGVQLTVNRWTLDGHGLKHHFSVKADGLGFWGVSGLFSFNGTKYFISGRFAEYDQVTHGWLGSDCGLLVFSGAGLSQIDLNSEGNNHRLATPQSRVEVAARSIAFRLVNYKTMDDTIIVAMIRSQYKTLWPYYADLDTDILSFIQTRQFYDLIVSHQTRLMTLWPTKAYSYLAYMYQMKGYTRSKLDSDIKSTLHMRIMRRSLVTAALMSPLAIDTLANIIKLLDSNTYVVKEAPAQTLFRLAAKFCRFLAGKVLKALKWIFATRYESVVPKPTLAASNVLVREFTSTHKVVTLYQPRSWSTLVAAALGVSATAVLSWATYVHVAPRIVQWTMSPVADDRRAAIQEMMPLVGTPKVGMVMCSKAFIKKHYKPRTTAFPTQTPGIVYKIDYPDTTLESKCEIMGTAIPLPGVYPTPCNENLEAALKIRMGFKRDIDPNEPSDFLQWCKNILRTLPDLYVHPKDQLEFLCKTYGSVKGARLYELSHVALTKSDASAELFVKGEVYLGKNEENFKPRMIWSRGPKVVSHFAETFDQITNQIKDLWFKGAAGGRVLYCSGTSPVDVGSKASEINHCAYVYDADVSNWDGSMADHFLDLELMILDKVHGLPENFSFLVENWKKVSGSSRDKGVMVSMQHGRRSGDLWTSIFNSVINWLITLYVMDMQVDSDYHMLVLGDDNVVGFNVDDVDYKRMDIVATYKRLGMKVELNWHDDVRTAKFCSGQFYPVDGKLIWGNLPFRTLAKFGWNHNKLPGKLFKSLLYGIAKSQLMTTSFIPIISAFQTMIIDSANEKNIKSIMPKDEWWRIGAGMKHYFGAPAEDTREFFEEIYGIPVIAQIYLENWIRENLSIDSFPFVLDDPEFLRCGRIDLGLPDDDLCGMDLEIIESDVDLWEDAVSEEREKLEAGFNLVDRLHGAWRFGAEEDQLLGNNVPTHAMLHSIFTFVSHFNLTCGVSLHVAYNRVAQHISLSQANKKKAKMRGRSAPPKKKMTRSASISTKKVVKNLVRSAASMAGGYFAGPVGAKLASEGVDLMSRVTGFGDYKVRNNTLLSPTVPEFGKTGHSIRIKHREYLGDVLSSTNWQTNVWEVNPGNSQTFPWLSTIANSYYQYRFHGLIFAFNSTSATALNSTNTALGTLIMASQYDVLAPNFLNKQEMDAHEFACSTKPSDSKLHALECAPAESPTKYLYVRSGSLPPTADPRWYDVAKFTLATIGSQATSNIGELWVTYDVELMKTRLPSGGPAPGLFFNTRRSGINTTTQPLGTIDQGVRLGTLPLSVDNFNKILWPFNVYSGRYLITIAWYGGSTVTVTAPLFTYVGCSIEPATALGVEDVPFFSSVTGTSTNVQIVPPAGTTGVAGVVHRQIVNVDSPQSTVAASITVGNLGAGVPVGYCDIIVVSLPTSNVAW